MGVQPSRLTTGAQRREALRYSKELYLRVGPTFPSAMLGATAWDALLRHGWVERFGECYAVPIRILDHHDLYLLADDRFPRIHAGVPDR